MTTTVPLGTFIYEGLRRDPAGLEPVTSCMRGVHANH